jgi:hypothetical protein
MKGDKKIFPIHKEGVIEGGGNYKDYEYLIVFTVHGHRCGYVALKEKESNKFEKESKGEDYYYPDINCHGGVTFYSNAHPAKELLPIPSNDFWIGFDAAHCDDIGCFETARKYFGNESLYDSIEKCYEGLRAFDNITHKTYDYMEQECKGIIDQLIQIQVAA